MIRLLFLAAAAVFGYRVAQENGAGLERIRSALGGGAPRRRTASARPARPGKAAAPRRNARSNAEGRTTH